MPKVPFDKVIVSCDESPMFLNFWPVVIAAWGKFFPDVEVEFAFVTNKDEDSPLVSKIRSYGGNVTLYPLEPTIPSSNQGKIARHYHAAQQGNVVCSLHDMDTIPLQRNYLYDLLSFRVKDSLALIGREVLENTVDAGKVPLVPTTAEGYIFEDLYDLENTSYTDFVRSLIGHNKYDRKEDIMNQPFTTFSDESVLRAFREEWKGAKHFMRRDELRPLDPHTHWIDRGWFNNIDIQRLYSGFYTECNMLRPLKENYGAMQPIINYVTHQKDIEFLI
jgi:hypothetical protein